MLYWAGKFFQMVFWPLGFGLLLLLLSRLQFPLKVRRHFFQLGFLVLLLPSVPFLSNFMRAHLESQFPPQHLHQIPQREAIVVLGGTMNATLLEGDVPQELWGSRVVPTVILAKRFPKAWIIVSSGYTYPNIRGQVRTEADDMAELMVQLGVEPQRIIREPLARNTYENAAFSAKILREKKIEKLLLVTSALHMRRSMLLFRRVGLEPYPVSMAPEVPRLEFRPQDLLPDASALAGSTRALREYVGFWAYRLFDSARMLR